MKKKKKASHTPSPQTQTVLLYSILIFILSILTIILAVHIQSVPTPYDERPDRIDAYFSKHAAPLAGFGSTFVQAADRCDMDWRLLPAIAMQESSGGKRMMNNNPFGWGSAKIPFDSFHEAISEVGKHLCGHVSSTAKWYATTSTREKLYWYNGTVRASYPAEVEWIMKQI
jgi:hypothetical protein